MTTTDIQRIEQSLHIELPLPYRKALQETNLWNDEEEQPYFSTEASYLIEENQHLLETLPALTIPNTQTLLGRLTTFWQTISGAEKRERLAREWHELWTTGRRFYIGSDFGEEMYFIVLTESNPAVYCYSFELEANNARVVADSIPEWILEVQRKNRESEENP